jgi:hypothetical protein
MLERRSAEQVAVLQASFLWVWQAEPSARQRALLPHAWSTHAAAQQTFPVPPLPTQLPEPQSPPVEQLCPFFFWQTPAKQP